MEKFRVIINMKQGGAASFGGAIVASHLIECATLDEAEACVVSMELWGGYYETIRLYPREEAKPHV